MASPARSLACLTLTFKVHKWLQSAVAKLRSLKVELRSSRVCKPPWPSFEACGHHDRSSSKLEGLASTFEVCRWSQAAKAKLQSSLRVKLRSSRPPWPLELEA
ncbi:hypothetical protein NL676_000085 [Syzygium grande]|nr:hypothetical protein NL676_000085 [Syzygium grande]